MLHCTCCGNELQEDAIICRTCARVVQFKTHFSPSELDESEFYVESGYQPRRFALAGQPEIYRAGIVLLVFLIFTLAVNLGFDHLKKQNIIQNIWSANLAFSDVFIDRFSADDQVSVKGRLTNITDRNMQGVVIRVYVLNVVNQQIAEEYYFIEPDILQPGVATDFTVKVRCKTGLVHQVKVEIFDAQVQPEIVRPMLWS